jgi:uncharacterized protein YbaP (TraB family)
MFKNSLPKLLLTIYAACTLTNTWAQNANTLLWKIEGAPLKKPSYLYGTMHVTNKEVFDVNDSLLYFLQHCDGFANELDPVELMQLMVQRFTFDSQIPSMFEIISNNEKEINAHKDVYNKAVDKDDKRIKSTFLDGYLLKMAMFYNKKIGGLEAAANQLFSRSNNELMIVADKEEDIAIPTYTPFLQLYLDGNIDKMYTSAAYDEKMTLRIAKRNKDMVQNIKKYVGNESWVFAMGALHLPGSNGLIELLKKEGYRVTPVIKKNTANLTAVSLKGYTNHWQKQTGHQNSYNIKLPAQTYQFEYNKKRPSRFLYFDFADMIIYKSEHIANYGTFYNNPMFYTILIANNYINIEGGTLSGNYNKKNNYYEINYQNDNLKKIYRIHKLDNDLVINSIQTKHFTADKLQSIHYFLNSYQADSSYKTNQANTTLTEKKDSVLQIHYPVENGMEPQYSINEDIEDRDYKFDMAYCVNEVTHSSIIATCYIKKPGSILVTNKTTLNDFKNNILYANNQTMLLDTIIESNLNKIHHIKFVQTNNDVTYYTTTYIFNIENKLFTIKYNATQKENIELYDSVFLTMLHPIKLSGITFKPFTIKNIIETQLPAKPEIVPLQNNQGNEVVRNSYDSTTGSNFVISITNHNKYLSCKSTKELFDRYIEKNYIEGDSIIKRTDTLINNLPGCILETVSRQNSIIAKVLYINYGKQIIKLTTSGLPAYINSMPVQSFFEKVQILQPPTHKDFVFTNKKDALLETLQNPKSDSTSYMNAFEEVSYTTFDEKDFEKLFVLFKHESTNPRFSYLYINQRLHTALANLITPNTAQIIYKNWPNANNNLINDCIELLLLNKTTDAYVQAATFLSQKNIFSYNDSNTKSIRDSLLFAKEYYKVLLLYKKNYKAHVLAMSLAKNLVYKNMLTPQEVYNDTTGLLVNVNKYTKNINDDDSWSSNYILDLISLVDTLQLRSFIPWLQKFSTSNYENEVLEKAFTTLIKLNAPIDAFIKKNWDDVSFKYKLYNILCNAGKQNKLAPTLQNQREIRRSFLYNKLQHYLSEIFDIDPYEVLPQTTITSNRDGKISIMDSLINNEYYIYFIRYGEDVESYKGIACIKLLQWGTPISDNDVYFLDNLTEKTSKNDITEALKKLLEK